MAFAKLKYITILFSCEVKKKNVRDYDLFLTDAG